MKEFPEIIRYFQLDRYRAGIRELATDRTTMGKPPEIRVAALAASLPVVAAVSVPPRSRSSSH